MAVQILDELSEAAEPHDGVLVVALDEGFEVAAEGSDAAEDGDHAGGASLIIPVEGLSEADVADVIEQVTTDVGAEVVETELIDYAVQQALDVVDGGGVEVEDAISGGGAVGPLVLGPRVVTCRQGSRDFTDPNMWVNVQNSTCVGKGVQWVARPTAAVRKLISSNISEAGMSWWRNGKPMPRNAPHSNVWKDYKFHGSFRPVTTGDTVRMQDTLKFTVRVGGRTLPASIFFCLTVQMPR